MEMKRSGSSFDEIRFSLLNRLLFGNDKVILERTQCPASIGMGPNRLMARLATRRAKPDGLYHVPQRSVAEFVRGQRVSDLPGVGRSIAHRLQVSVEEFSVLVTCLFLLLLGNNVNQTFCAFFDGRSQRIFLPKKLN